MPVCTSPETVLQGSSRPHTAQGVPAAVACRNRLIRYWPFRSPFSFWSDPRNARFILKWRRVAARTSSSQICRRSFLSILASVCTSGCVKSSAPPAQEVAVVPMSLKPVGRFEFPVSAAEREWYRTQLVPRNRDFNESQCLHMLHVHGVDATFRDSHLGQARICCVSCSIPTPRRSNSDSLVLSAQGSASASRHHPRESRSDESHRDQTLAVLGHLGLPSDTQITLGNGVGTIREAIHDSIATFDLIDRRTRMERVELRPVFASRTELGKPFRKTVHVRHAR